MESQKVVLLPFAGRQITAPKRAKESKNLTSYMFCTVYLCSWIPYYTHKRKDTDTWPYTRDNHSAICLIAPGQWKNRPWGQGNSKVYLWCNSSHMCFSDCWRTVSRYGSRWCYFKMDLVKSKSEGCSSSLSLWVITDDTGEAISEQIVLVVGHLKYIFPHLINSVCWLYLGIVNNVFELREAKPLASLSSCSTSCWA